MHRRDALPRYRYRTPVLTGRWRETPDAALSDAITARQVRLEDSSPDGVRWIVPGEIEEEPLAEDARRRIGRR
jgi:hypothetical protein